MSKTIDAATLHNWQTRKQAFVLVDTLPANSYARGHLPGAIHIVSDDILARAGTVLLNHDARIVVYCASEDCKRAGLAAERLKRLGYRNVYHFVGGRKAWVAAGYPLESTSP